MEPEFMSDALDDLRADEVEQAATDPLVGYDAVLAFYGIDPVALQTASPFAYLMLGQAYFADLVRMQMIAHACMVGTLVMARVASERRPYQPVPGARNALRHSLHRMGVI
jgi:hypothetical protein